MAIKGNSDEAMAIKHCLIACPEYKVKGGGCDCHNRIRSYEPMKTISNKDGDDKFTFAEWCAKHYIRLENVWVHRFENQLDKENHQTTEELYEMFKSFIKHFG